MTTNYETALNEFRDASAAVRRAFGAVAEARELQIIADSQHKLASNNHAEAVARLERADTLLQAAREAPGISGNTTTVAVGTALDAIQSLAASRDAARPAAADADPTFGPLTKVDLGKFTPTQAAPEHYDATGETPATPRVTQADIDAIEPRANGSIDAQAAGLGIG